ncbi:MAG: iron-containing alcohol dehydrogenase [Christensenellaceae bacterium]|jgi:alcohol dehydrogenase YqhD (iron-dependent ADH family)|nr:iron-containing alcohol dehydrogenase [Christensenellaceae bacterium]
MEPFQYCKPTKILFGPGKYDELGEQVAPLGRTALLVQDAGPLEKLGVFQRAVNSLEAAGVRAIQLPGVLPNAHLSKIDEGIAICKREKVEVVVGIGGGSTIDSAKAIALGAVYDGDVWDFYSGAAKPAGALKIGAVTTISGTGSETDGSTIVSNDRSGNDPAKWNVFSPHAYPAFAIMDPELHVSVPRHLTAAGMADAIAHACEAYMYDFAVQPFMDEYVELLVRCMIGCSGVLDHLEDVELRGRVCWLSSQSIDGLGGIGRRINPFARWPAHAIQTGVGAVTNTRHGDGLAVLLPACFLQVNEENPIKTKRFALQVFGIEQRPGMSDKDVGREGILALRAMYERWGLATTLKGLGVKKEQLPEIVDNVMAYPGRGLIKREYVQQVLESCFE